MPQLSPTSGPAPTISSLLAWFKTDPGAMKQNLDRVLAAAARTAEPVWICRVDPDAASDQLKQGIQRQASGIPQPLLGIPFAVKDNIDVAGLPTTAGCPGFSYVAKTTATAVQRLLDAGAILIGKTNLDQFATGLVGTRSPFGACRNPFNTDYISGGSSSGSAVAVALGMVSFSLGTDTAGSGRVPAAFNNIVGLKPTRGLVSTTGVVPACRSLDCVSVFALTCEDAAAVYSVLKGYDSQDGYSRRASDLPARLFPPRQFRFGIPADSELKFFGNSAAEKMFSAAVDQLRQLGGQVIEIDFRPFIAAAQLLYDGPWVAERYAAVGEFIDKNPGAVLPVTKQIISKGKSVDGVSAFRAQYQLESLRNQARAQWEKMDLLLLPTTGTIYTLAEIEADPVGPNTNLGYYTNFANLLDLCAVAVPNGFQPDGLPAGVTLLAPAGLDESLLAIASSLHRATSQTMGATGQPLPEVPQMSETPSGWVELAVVGAHLSGQPLNHQLTSLNAQLVKTCPTTDAYRLFALPGTVPPKPGMIRVEPGKGVPQEIEVWAMSVEAFGSFVAAIPQPLGVGTINLSDGTQVKSFLCESIALVGARDISQFGGWRNFLAAK